MGFSKLGPMQERGRFRHRWGVRAALVGALLFASSAIVGCQFLGGPGVPVTPAQTATPIPATPTPVPYPTPLPPAEVSQEEAEAVVHAWFDAIIAQDYQTAKDLTSGSATTHTQELADGFQEATGGKGVTVALMERRLDLSPGPKPASGRVVETSFDIQVNASIGPIIVAAQEIEGTATFTVQRVNGRTRITNIRDVTGLPT